jgi:hypothetical protein
MPTFAGRVCCVVSATNSHGLYEEQRATMMAILSENRKKECPKSATELLRPEGKKIVQRVSYFIKKFQYVFKNFN